MRSREELNVTVWLGRGDISKEIHERHMTARLGGCGEKRAPNNNIKLESYNSLRATLRLLIFNPAEPLRLKVKIYCRDGIILLPRCTSYYDRRLSNRYYMRASLSSKSVYEALYTPACLFWREYKIWPSVSRAFHESY